MNDCILHIDRPATSWDNATPVGNGRMGMMLMGDPARECVYLNEDSIWAGNPPEPCVWQAGQVKSLTIDAAHDRPIEVELPAHATLTIA